MTATLNGKVNGSAYPIPVEALLPKAQKLTEELGSVPSRNRLMTELKIGRDKANAVLAELLADDPTLPGVRDPFGAGDVDTPLVPSPLVEVAVAPGPETRSAAGRWHAWGGFLFAAIASLAANVAHAHDGWGPRLTAAFAPLALVLAVEVAARVDWRSGREWWLARWVGTGSVAVITFVVSYRAQAALFKTYGLDWISAAILPLAVDGLMLVCIAALLSIGNRRK